MRGNRGLEKLLLVLSSSFVLLYCVLVLGYVATFPDLRIRVLLADDDRQPVSGNVAGVVIRDTPGLIGRGSLPTVQDVVVRVGDQRIRGFPDFVRSLSTLRRAAILPGWLLKDEEDPSAFQEPHPSVVELENGQRLVEVEFRRGGHAGQSQTAWVAVQSVPLDEILLTFIWFLLQLGITGVSALAVWHRPFDRPVRQFFAMCLVTMGAFVGGFHWWIVASSLWLNLPFVACAVSFPVVSLQFFLMYPRRTWPLTQFPRTALSALYFVPLAAFAWIVVMLGSTTWPPGGADWSNAALMSESLNQLRNGIYAYMTFASGCFLVMLAALAAGYARTANPLERSQLKWMFRGGLMAVVPVSYTLYLALFDRVEFALGRARLSMFLASLSFMLAYAIAMLRFKLMLIDQLVSKGMRYYSASVGVSASFAGLIVLSSLTANYWNTGGAVFPHAQQMFFLGAVLLVAVMMLLWGRDRLQQLIDRNFYREKYQLDKALQRMNRAVERVGDRETLARRMVASCRDVLRTERVAVYLRDVGQSSFQLMAMEGNSDMPTQFLADEDLLTTLQQEPAVARSVVPLGAGVSSSQQILRSLRAELMYAFESDGELAGVVVLGPKQGANVYTAEDLTFMNALGQITSVALHSVKVHQDISRLNDELRLKVEKIEEQRRVISMLQQEVRTAQRVEPQHGDESAPSDFQRDHIKGNSPAIRRVLETVRKVSQSESSILITGPSGTGKELLARAIHENSSRRDGPLVSVHCAALSPSLLESELFGHVKGAFTGAHKDRVGRFESAHGGTLFLDEIGDISLETQIKLLRVLQTRQFEPVGGTRTVQVDVRLIAATHQDLKKLIVEGRFREDLYYRLNVISIMLPTLAERKEDVLELSLHFLKKSSERLGKLLTEIDDDALEALKRYRWPGNIRELENVIERAVVLADGDAVTLQDLPREVVNGGAGYQRSGSAKSHSDERSKVIEPALVGAGAREEGLLEEYSEREALENALRSTSGNKAEAARLLGMPRSTFFSKLRKYRINKPR